MADTDGERDIAGQVMSGCAIGWGAGAQGVLESWTQLGCMRLEWLSFVVVPRLLLRIRGKGPAIWSIRRAGVKPKPSCSLHLDCAVLSQMAAEMKEDGVGGSM